MDELKTKYYDSKDFYLAENLGEDFIDLFKKVFKKLPLTKNQISF